MNTTTAINHRDPMHEADKRPRVDGAGFYWEWDDDGEHWEHVSEELAPVPTLAELDATAGPIGFAPGHSIRRVDPRWPNQPVRFTLDTLTFEVWQSHASEWREILQLTPETARELSAGAFRALTMNLPTNQTDRRGTTMTTAPATPERVQLTAAALEQLAEMRKLPNGEDWLLSETTDRHIGAYGPSVITAGLWTFEGKTEVVLDLIDIESGDMGGSAVRGITSMTADEARHLATVLMHCADAADARSSESQL